MTEDAGGHDETGPYGRAGTGRGPHRRVRAPGRRQAATRAAPLFSSRNVPAGPSGAGAAKRTTGHRGYGDPRHHAAHPQRRRHHRPGPLHLDGPVPHRRRSALPHPRMMLHLPAFTATADPTAPANRPRNSSTPGSSRPASSPPSTAGAEAGEGGGRVSGRARRGRASDTPTPGVRVRFAAEGIMSLACSRGGARGPGEPGSGSPGEPPPSPWAQPVAGGEHAFGALA